MEKGLKEYFAKLAEKFWQIGNNPKIKFEFGYEELDDNQGMDWFVHGMHRQYQPEQFDLGMSVMFYKFYSQLVEDEPEIVDFLSTVPLSYHKILITKCSDAYEALTYIAKSLENDWSLAELKAVFDLKLN